MKRNNTGFFYVIFLTLLTIPISYGAIPRATIGDIPYRTYGVNDTDSYMKSRCRLDISFPINGNKLPTIVFLHGGGLTSGAKFFPNGGLENENIIQVAANYRLSPKSLCPSYIEDAAAALAWVFNHITEYGGDPRSIYLSGVSAGAYLVNMLYLDKSYLEVYKIDPDSLAGLFSYSSQMTTHYQVCQEEFSKVFNSDTKFIDKYAPLFNVRKTFTPVYIFTGDSILDMPGRYVQNKEITNKLRELGNSQVYYIQFKGYDHNTFLPSAINSTIKILRNDLVYLDSIKNRQLYTANKSVSDVDSPNMFLSHGYIRIHSKETIKFVSIYDIRGILVAKISINDFEGYIDAHKFNLGTYIANVVTVNGEYFQKLIIK